LFKAGLSTEAEKGTIQKDFANPRKIVQIAMFCQKSLSKSLSKLKTITNPKKIIGSTNNSSNNPKYFANP